MEPVFRPFKRARLNARQRVREEEDEAEDVVKKPVKTRAPAPAVEEPESESEAEEATDAVKRFLPQQGMRVVSDDSHMQAYIAARLTNETSDEPELASGSSLTKARPAASLGRIQEVEVTPKLQPIRREKAPKVRKGLGPDGKPWRPRKIKKKGSDEILREKALEEFLKESSLDLYAKPKLPELRDEDFPLLEEHQPRRRPPKKERENKGPKLGGSRNARAAMRNA